MPTTRPDQVSDSDIPNYVAAKGQAVYAVNTIGLYKKGDFSKRNRIKYYKRAVRINRPEFVVKGYKRDKSGKLRYRVQQYSTYAKRYIKETSGYITSSVKYVIPAYYATLPANKKIKIINPNGINSYRKRALTGEIRHFKKGQILKVKKIVKYKYTTRYQLLNDRYITANKKFVIFTKFNLNSLKSQNAHPF